MTEQTNPSPHPSERRRVERVRIETPAELQVILPEQTFTPYPIPGALMDISQLGMRFTSLEVKEELYRELMHGVRYGKIKTCLPGSSDKLQYIGKLVWVHYNNQTSPPVCSIGLMFDKLNDAQSNAVRHCMELVNK